MQRYVCIELLQERNVEKAQILDEQLIKYFIKDHRTISLLKTRNQRYKFKGKTSGSSLMSYASAVVPPSSDSRSKRKSSDVVTSREREVFVRGCGALRVPFVFSCSLAHTGRSALYGGEEQISFRCI